MAQSSHSLARRGLIIWTTSLTIVTADKARMFGSICNFTATIDVVEPGTSGPPQSAKVKMDGFGVAKIVTSRSLVWYPQTSTAKTPRIRGLFRIHPRIRAGSLCTHSLGGGGGNLGDLVSAIISLIHRENNRERLRSLTFLTEPEPRFPCISIFIATDSL